MPEAKSLIFYNDSAQAERYHQRKGFAPERTTRMHEVMLDLLTTLTAPQSTVLELGCGTGLLTEKLLKANHFREIYATDGAAAMLDIARRTLETGPSRLHFRLLDFTTDWPGLFAGTRFDAVTSSMALHHAEDKQRLFQQIFTILKPQGVFILADHMAGASAWTEHLLVRERAVARLGRENQADSGQIQQGWLQHEQLQQERLQEIMDGDAERGRKEGNHCESTAQYQSYLKLSGFEDAECIWRDYWLAVFVARKRGA